VRLTAQNFPIRANLHAEINDRHHDRDRAGDLRLSWQIIPAKFFAEWVKDAAGLQPVTHEVWQMRKLDLAKLQKAFAGK